uniref:Uncharacterized protein n=1 Tax=Anopheles dirus TaxID=7168 RepID=A0A182NXQ9_9DIPT
RATFNSESFPPNDEDVLGVVVYHFVLLIVGYQSRNCRFARGSRYCVARRRCRGTRSRSFQAAGLVCKVGYTDIVAACATMLKPSPRIRDIFSLVAKLKQSVNPSARLGASNVARLCCFGDEDRHINTTSKCRNRIEPPFF